MLLVQVESMQGRHRAPGSGHAGRALRATDDPAVLPCGVMTTALSDRFQALRHPAAERSRRRCAVRFSLSAGRFVRVAETSHEVVRWPMAFDAALRTAWANSRPLQQSGQSGGWLGRTRFASRLRSSRWRAGNDPDPAPVASDPRYLHATWRRNAGSLALHIVRGAVVRLLSRRVLEVARTSRC